MVIKKTCPYQVGFCKSGFHLTGQLNPCQIIWPVSLERKWPMGRGEKKPGKGGKGQ